MTTEQLPEGLSIAVEMIGEYVQSIVACHRHPVTGELAPHAEIDQRHGVAAIEAIRAEHQQRVTLQRRVDDQAQRIAELEGERDEWKRIASAYSPQKELASALTQAKEAGRKARQERDELRARLAEIDAQGPEAQKVAPSQTAGMSMAQRILHVGGRNNSAGYVEFGSVQAVKALVLQALRDARLNYARLAPVPAQAAPDGWRLAPVEPTMAMMQAALTASRAKGPISGSMEFSLPVCHELSAAELVYRAMIAAAPEATR